MPLSLREEYESIFRMYIEGDGTLNQRTLERALGSMLVRCFERVPLTDGHRLAVDPVVPYLCEVLTWVWFPALGDETAKVTFHSDSIRDLTRLFRAILDMLGAAEAALPAVSGISGAQRLKDARLIEQAALMIHRYMSDVDRILLTGDGVAIPVKFFQLMVRQCRRSVEFVLGPVAHEAFAENFLLAQEMLLQFMELMRPAGTTVH